MTELFSFFLFLFYVFKLICFHQNNSLLIYQILSLHRAVCLLACMHACVCVHVHVCVHPCMHACMRVHACECVCVCVRQYRAISDCPRGNQDPNFPYVFSGQIRIPISLMGNQDPDFLRTIPDCPKSRVALWHIHNNVSWKLTILTLKCAVTDTHKKSKDLV